MKSNTQKDSKPHTQKKQRDMERIAIMRKLIAGFIIDKAPEIIEILSKIDKNRQKQRV